MKKLFSFPNPVNDAAARTVATGVVVHCVLALITNAAWLLIPLTYGVAARVATGPTLSPLGRFATEFAAPRIEKTASLRHIARLLPGPPKRFAQGVGLVFSGSATIVWLTAGWAAARWILLPLTVAASLEAFLGLCLGCTAFGWLMKIGLIPASVCADCADLSGHFARVSQQKTADPVG
jgi:hypothetical protein